MNIFTELQRFGSSCHDGYMGQGLSYCRISKRTQHWTGKGDATYARGLLFHGIGRQYSLKLSSLTRITSLNACTSINVDFSMMQYEYEQYENEF